MAASMVPIMLEILLLPLFVAMAIREGKRQAAERARRLEAYRASPESHLLNLNSSNPKRPATQGWAFSLPRPHCRVLCDECYYFQRWREPTHRVSLTNSTRGDADAVLHHRKAR